MFGDLMGNMQEKQEALKKKLSSILVEAEAGNGAVRVQANAARQITNISLDASQLDLGDLEQLEDLLLTATNRALELALAEEAAESQRLISEMLPPGFGNLFGQ